MNETKTAVGCVILTILFVGLMLIQVLLLSACAVGPLPGVPAFETPAQAYDWVYNSGAIQYRKDAGLGNCARPEETLARGYGDCEDLTLLTQCIIDQQFGLNCWMALGFCADGGAHAEPFMNGQFFNPEGMRRLGFKPWTYLSYDVALMCEPILFNEKGAIE